MTPEALSNSPELITSSPVPPQNLTETSSDQWDFSLTSPGFSLYTRGLHRQLPPGHAETLDARVRHFFAETPPNAPNSPQLIVGALPFDRKVPDILFAPQQTSDRPFPHTSPAPLSARHFKVTPEPSRSDYAAAVTKALAALAEARDAGDRFTKVVLARTLLLEAQDGPVAPAALLERLQLLTRRRADPQTLRFMTPLGPSPTNGAAPPQQRWLVGATPELLVSKHGADVVSHPLAGSARRSPDISEDEAAAKSLLASAKDRREHAMVVEAILDLLNPLCSELHVPTEPAMVSTGTMWHLGTRIVGQLRHPGEISSAGLAALLHPTPAVAGTPRDRATELIKALEPVDRGFYAGTVGWNNAEGDGAWHVSLRCAEISGHTARLYAGAGIVEGSDPEAEAAETSGKLLAMLNAFGIDERGYPAEHRD